MGMKQRFVELLWLHGRKLPSKEEVAAGERHAEAQIVLDEMHKIQREIDALIGTKIAPPLKPGERPS